MPQAAIILLDRARVTREKAQRARRLAEGLNSDDVAQRLFAYAGQLEATACSLEERAAALHATVARTRGLSREIRDLTAEADRRIQELRDTLTPK